MVKGTTRQVVVVKGAGSTPFEQAIFLVRDSVLSQGGVTEDVLLKEARKVCRNSSNRSIWRGAAWYSLGAGCVGLAWLMTIFF